MIRIIIGTILLVGLLNSTMLRGVPHFATSEETTGYILAQFVFLALSIWLIQSGINKRRAKKSTNAN